MKKRPPFPTAKVALLMLPVLFLAGLAFWLPDKPEVPFELRVREVIVKPMTPHRGNRRMEVIVYTHHVGPEPRWWRNYPRAQWVQNMRFVNAKGQEYSLTNFGGGGSEVYDEERQSHVCRYTGLVPLGYDIYRPGQFKGTVVMANQLAPLKPLGTAHFSVPVQF